ncbi:MAG: AAA family ATPase [Alphaproteobacteria bacterium]|nr:AAA family ATPase [Alphaproteobacteria bacterium]
MFLKSLELINFLSFGESGQKLELQPLTVLIGPHSAGKSNLIEAIALIRATSAKSGLRAAIREGGAVRDWLWQGGRGADCATICAVLEPAEGVPALKTGGLRYSFSFSEVEHRFTIVSESVESGSPEQGQDGPCSYYRYAKGHATAKINGRVRSLQVDGIDSSASILSQRGDPEHYPELMYLGDVFARIRLYREWSFGRQSMARLPQKADLPDDFLEPDASNLGLVLNRLRRDAAMKQRLLAELNVLCDGIDDFDVRLEGGTVEVLFHEGRRTIPATRLSDGTLRYLGLLAILCHRTPPPLLCIEEPELGLHPDVLPGLASLLKETSTRTQLILTTHSDILVDCFTDEPQSVVVTERSADGTTLTRLNGDRLKPWLEKYRLGQLWTRGDLGGTRW